MEMSTEERMKEVLYSLNRLLWRLDKEDSKEYYVVTEVRDNLFKAGQREYGWSEDAT